MGGEHSGISDDTTNVLLEGAFWNPAIIQGRSRRLGFTSDAGYRFERGVDFDGSARAVERATALILECCGGKAGPLSDVKGVLPPRAAVRVRPARVTRLLGVALPAPAIGALFGRLGFSSTREGDDFLVTPPSYRFDLAIEEDFVEEVARLHGFDVIPVAVSAQRQAMLPAAETTRPTMAVKRLLVARGWQEAITFNFVSSAWESALFPGRDERGAPVGVRNPIAAHLDVMRTTLAGGLLDVLRTNLARKQERVRIFEVGRCYQRAVQGYDQPMRLGGLAYGDALPEQWGCASRFVDLFDVKADLAALVAPRTMTTVRAELPMLHPGRAAGVWVDGVDIGWLGEMHPGIAKAFELPRTPILFELDFAALLASGLPAARPVSKLPIVRRDMAVVVADSVAAQDVMSVLEAAKPPHVEALRLFDVYRGAGIEAGMKSLAILVLMQDTERTLTDVEIDATMAGLLQLLALRFGATLRQ
jgi:phenylalanyl-tRNA synthetase beta chain